MQSQLPGRISAGSAEFPLQPIQRRRIWLVLSSCRHALLVSLHELQVCKVLPRGLPAMLTVERPDRVLQFVSDDSVVYPRAS